MKKYFLLLMPVLICYCYNENNKDMEPNKNFNFNNNGSDIIICNNKVNIAIVVDDDLYILFSDDDDTWKSKLITTNTHIDQFWRRPILGCYNGIINICYNDKYFHSIYYIENMLSSLQPIFISNYFSNDFNPGYSFTIDRSGMFYAFIEKYINETILYQYFLKDITQYSFTSIYNIYDNIGIQVDPEGIIHIIFLIAEEDIACSKIMHLFGNINAWNSETIGQCVIQATFSIDDVGAIHLQYTQEIEDYDYQDYFIIWQDGKWQDADPTGKLKSACEFNILEAIAKNDNILHLFGSKTVNNVESLYYLSNKSGNWYLKLVADSRSKNFGSFSFDIDDENNAYIAYCDSEDTFDSVGPVKLYYVTDKTGEWVRHEVDFTP